MRLVAKSHHDVPCVASVLSRVWAGRVPGIHAQETQRRRARRGTAHGSHPQGRAEQLSSCDRDRTPNPRRAKKQTQDTTDKTPATRTSDSLTH